MTETKTAPRDYCGQHRQPLSECEDWDRHNHSMRFREDDWQLHERSAKALRLATTTEYVDQAANVAEGYLRCHRGGCTTDGPPIPVTFGDLTGKTLGEWITLAVKRAGSQHPRHEPVMIGAAPSGTVVPATPESLLRARARTRPGAMKFMEPGSEPHVTPVPEVPVRSKKGRATA